MNQAVKYVMLDTTVAAVKTGLPVLAANMVLMLDSLMQPHAKSAMLHTFAKVERIESHAQ